MIASVSRQGKKVEKGTMPDKKTRKQITIETHQLTVVRSANRAVRVRCEECARQVSMVPPEEAAMLARVTPRTIYRWVEEGRLHFLETQPGQLTVCVESLLRDQ